MEYLRQSNISIVIKVNGKMEKCMDRGLFIMTMVVCKADFIDLFAGDLEKGKINMKMESLISDNFKTKAKMDSVHIILTIEITTKASGKIINSMGKEWSTIMTD